MSEQERLRDLIITDVPKLDACVDILGSVLVSLRDAYTKAKRTETLEAMRDDHRRPAAIVRQRVRIVALADTGEQKKND